MSPITHARLQLKHSMIGGLKGLNSFLTGLANVEVLELQVPFAQLQEVIVLPKVSRFQKLRDSSVGAFCMCSGFCWCLCRGEEGPTTSESAEASLKAAISQCKGLEFVEIKYSRSDQTVGRLVDAFVDGTKELQNVNLMLSKQ